MRFLRVSILTAALAVSITLLFQHRELVTERSAYWRNRLSTPNRLCLAQCAEQYQAKEIPLKEPIELDFLGKDDVFEIRRQAVFSQPELVNSSYQPYAAVYGQIVDRQPWWGLQGIYYRGSGEHAIDGLSEESRFLINPFLFVGILEPTARIVHKAEGGMAYPRPVKLEFDAKGKSARVLYDLSRYYEYLKRYKADDIRSPTLSMTLLNARDFGFGFFFIDSERSSNVYWHHDGNEPARIIEFIHGHGGSCGYPGGCNNGSPYQRELHFTPTAFPAKAEVKLWQDTPSSSAEPADFLFVIEMTVNG
jgi:hypothetical protein